MIIQWYIEEKINKLLLMYQQTRGNLPLSNTSQDALAISDIMMLSLPYFSLFNWEMKIYYITKLFKRLFCIFNHPRLRNSGIISIKTVISVIDSGIRITLKWTLETLKFISSFFLEDRGGRWKGNLLRKMMSANYQNVTMRAEALRSS